MIVMGEEDRPGRTFQMEHEGNWRVTERRDEGKKGSKRRQTWWSLALR